MRLTAAQLASLHADPLPSLETVNLSKKGYTEIRGLDTCLKLTKLDLSDNELTDLKCLVANEQLTWLSVKSNALKTLQPLSEHGRIAVLNAAHNQLADVEGLRASAPRLKALILNNNKLSELNFLRGMNNLNTLVLSHNDISSLGKSLNVMPHLSKLSVSHNKLDSLGGAIKKCYALTELRISHNRLKVVMLGYDRRSDTKSLPSELLHNPRLKILDASGNAFATRADVEVLQEMPELVSVSFIGSPLSQRDDYKQTIMQLVPRLEVLDGRRVEGSGGKKKQRRNAKISHEKTEGDTKHQDDADSDRDEERPADADSKQGHVKFGAAEDAKADALAAAAAAARKKKLKKGLVGELQADGEEATGGGFLSQVMTQQELYKPAKAKASGLVAVHEKKANASVKLKGSSALKAMLQGRVDTLGGGGGWGDDDDEVGLLRTRKERTAAGGRESTEEAELGAGPAAGVTVTMGLHIDKAGRKRGVEAVAALAGVAASPSVNPKKQKSRQALQKS